MFAAGDPTETLATLAEWGVTVTLGRDRQLLHVRPRPVDPIAAELIRSNRPLVHAALLGAEGRRYGTKKENGKVRTTTLRHVWARCDQCSEGFMRKKGAGAKRCVITPGCSGKHEP